MNSFLDILEMLALTLTTLGLAALAVLLVGGGAAALLAAYIKARAGSDGGPVTKASPPSPRELYARRRLLQRRENELAPPTGYATWGDYYKAERARRA